MNILASNLNEEKVIEEAVMKPEEKLNSCLRMRLVDFQHAYPSSYMQHMIMVEGFLPVSNDFNFTSNP